jgi:alkyl hydroperoxide reductase subunit D
MDNISLDKIRDAIPDYARDLRLNLGSVLSTEGAPGLKESRIWAVALASAIACRNPAFTRTLEAVATTHLDAAHLQAARSAAAIMGMNNIYYRFLHLVEDSEYQSLPARLRMNVLANPGIDKLDFELLSLAVSAVNGCGLCISSHEKKLRQHGFSRESIQSAVRIAATIHAVAAVLEYASEAQEAPGAHSAQAA